MSGDNLVSVVMPVLEPDARMLREAVRSVLAQENARLELIIVEDPGSGADGSGVVSSFNDDRIVYVKNAARTSFAAQLNAGVARSTGAWIARMDADDICGAGRLSRQLEFLRNHPDVSVAGSNLVIIDAAGREIGYRAYPEKGDAIAGGLKKRNVMAHPSVMFRKDHFIAMKGYSEGFGAIADYELWCRMQLNGYKFYNLQDYLLSYRVHAGASKVKALKDTIRQTLQIKSIHFRGKSDLWNSSDEARYKMEQVLLGLPAWLVLRLFMLFTVNRKL